MKHFGASALLAAAGLVSAGAADTMSAQSAQTTDRDGGAAAVRAAFEGEEAAAIAGMRQGHDVFAGASRFSSFTQTWTILSFSVDAASDRETGVVVPAPKAWRVRRIAGDAAGHRRDEWARSEDCPALEPALAALEQVSLPVVDVPGVGEDWKPKGLAVAADRASYRLWSSSLRHGDARQWEELDLKGAFNSPLADWMDETLATLKPCWKPLGPAPRSQGTAHAAGSERQG
jgi:hypothetical protein